MKPNDQAQTRLVSRHQAYSATCKTCGVAAYISEKTLMRLIQRGLAQQNLQVTAIAGLPQGTPRGIILPLVRELRKKGIAVT